MSIHAQNSVKIEKFVKIFRCIYKKMLEKKLILWANVGKRVKKLRNERNLSQTKFGKMIGISGQYLGMIEKGANNLSVDLIVKICDVTGVSSDYILFGIIGSEQGITAAACLDGLSDEQFEIALEIIKKVAKFIKTNGGNSILIQEIFNQDITKS